MKMTLFKKKISMEDLSYLHELLETGLPLGGCLELLKTKKTQDLFADILRKLERGEMMENIIEDHLEKKISFYMVPLLKTLSFKDALHLSLSFYEKHHLNRKELLGSVLYPAVLLYVSLTALLLFDRFGMDMIFNLLSSFQTDLFLFQRLRTAARILVVTVYILSVTLGLAALFLFSQKRIVMTYIFLSSHFRNSLFHIYFCEEFVSLLICCMKKGYKTKEALDILKNMKHQPIIAFLAFHLDEQLLTGNSLKEASGLNYYDVSLSRFLKIASFTKDYLAVLDNYVELSRSKIRRKMKQISRSVQICNYFFIGTVIIFIYQALFLPMKAISIY